MIEDQELCSLFKMESEEHLQKLDEGLLRLESSPQDSAVLEEVFRAAHSLKGAARMLGVSDVETIAHHFEDALGAARRGRTVLTSEVIDRLYSGLDAIRELTLEAVTGAAANVNVERVLALLNGAEPSTPVEETAEESVEKTIESTTEIAPEVLIPEAPFKPEIAQPEYFHPAKEPEENNHSAPTVSSLNPALQGAFKIETIRVQPQKLDGLMTLAAELTVTTTRVARGLGVREEIVELWENWNKDLASQRSEQKKSGMNARSGEDRSTPRRTDKTSAAFYDREHARLEKLKAILEQLKRTANEDVARLNFAANELEESIRKIRLLPFSTVFDLFPRLVRDLARDQKKEIQLLLEGESTTADKRILEELKDPLMHIIRNAVDHGIEAPEERAQNGKPTLATLRLRAFQTATSVVVEISDDGRGLDEAAIARTALKRRVASEEELAAMTREQMQMLIFAPGFSTSPIVTDVSGRGVGLDVVRANVESLHGNIKIESEEGNGCTFRLQMPLTLATTRVLLVQVAARPYALPVEFLQGSRLVAKEEIFSIEGRDNIALNGQPISVVRLSDLLELTAARSTPDALMPCIILQIGEEKLGLFVDAFLDEQEVILQPLGALLPRVRNVAGSTILGTGEVCMILNSQDLMKTMHKTRATIAPVSPVAAIRKQVILLAEDSITTRTQEKRIIESAGYEVVTAVDGMDAMSKLSTQDFDGVVSDVEMPNLDGLGLAARIRQDARYKELPIILVTSLATDADKQRGVEVGANAYITKGTFEQKALIDALRRLV